MLNLAVGNPLMVEGRECLATPAGQPGYAIYGPYETRTAGAYTVDFYLERAGGTRRWRDAVCAVVDVVRDCGNDILASRAIKLSELRDGRTRFSLDFVLPARSALEYRIWTSGVAPLHLDHHRQIRHRAEPVAGATILHEPVSEAASDPAIPAFVRQHHADFRNYHALNFGISLRDGDAILTYGGLNVLARCTDDLNFIGEVLIDSVYDFSLPGPVCAIDIGMNVGYSSLQFARRDDVEEVVAFEPFVETYRRALDNFALNPSIATKISAFCFGLLDKDWSGDVPTSDADMSGSKNVLSTQGDGMAAVELRDAAGILGPVIRQAREHGRRVVLKVDCEGSEFAIFRSLERAGLFASVDAVMVEWHAMFGDLTQEDLIRPLRAAGFIVFDRSPPSGNGFFYGARLGAID